MRKLLLIIISSILVISCGGGNYKVKKYNNEVPKWYVSDKKDSKNFYGKALGESESLELANREAEALAVSNAIFKIKQEIDAVRNQYLSKKFSKAGKKAETSIQSDYEEKINLAIKNYEITEYRVSNKNIFKDTVNYKVFVEIEFNKKQLFEKLDQIRL